MSAITKPEFDKSKVRSIYTGLDQACRCGCKGEYVMAFEPADAKRFAQRLKRFEAAWKDYQPIDDDVGGNYLNVSYGHNRAICVYIGGNPAI